jgi:hypothetical protein
MVNKLLIGVGIAALVAVGSIGVWKLAEDDGRRVGALGPIDEPMPLSWRGTWTSEAKYDVGQVVSYKGSSYVAEAANAGEVPNEKEGPWGLMAAQGAQGAQGPAGTFTGTFQSPDGKYTLSVTNAGIDARGPNAQLTLDANGVLVKSGTTLVLDAGATLDLKAAAAATLRGAQVRLGCSSGGSPVVRVGNQVQVTGSGAVGAGGGGFTVNSTGVLQQGSPTVLAC